MKISEISFNNSPFTYLQDTQRLAAWSTYVQNYAIFPKTPKLPSLRTPGPVFRTSTKQHFSSKTLDANWCVSHPAACLSCFLFDLWIEIGLPTNVWCTKQMVIRGWMFNRSCSVDFLISHFWAVFLTLNPSSRTSFTPLAKVVDRLLFCVLELLRKGLIRFDVLLPFPLTPLE